MPAELQSINPATGETVATYAVHDAQQVDAAVRRADEQHHAWRRVPFAARAVVLHRTADQLEARRDELATLMADEMGKPVSAGRAEADKCAWVCRYYADHAEGFLADEAIDTGHTASYVRYQPLGVVLAIMPWNFPLWQVYRFAAPALMAGNAGVLKHASNVTGASLAIAEMFEAAGLPAGLFASLVIPSSAVEPVIGHELVRAVTLTGSEAAGRAVAAEAGAALKKTVLELGGSDPYVVLADADVEQAAKVCAQSRLINSGQSCIAAKRFIVVDQLHDAFVDAMRAAFESTRVGDPRDEDTDVGPMARSDLRDELHEQVERSVADGAHLVVGGDPADGPGAFYPPTILTAVEPGMAAADEELFGPVAAVMRARDDERAVELANATRFGLGAAVFTADEQRGAEVAAMLDAGSIAVNTLVASDPRLPFGGVKASGYGRELSHHGIREFVNIKTVVVS
jgi:succinate-semialdehyde dehydrogenase/glutarate-semialdehyde dehydrogenase